MMAEIVRLKVAWHGPDEDDSAGVDARAVLCEIISHMAECPNCSALSAQEQTDTILGSLWIEGYKVTPLTEEDCEE